MTNPSPVRQAPYALRVVQRKGGRAAIVYCRQADECGRDRLQRVAGLAPLAYTAALPMLREALRTAQCAVWERGEAQKPGAYHPLGADWGVRVACFALTAAGLRDGERLLRAAEHLRQADPNQAAWWLGLLMQADHGRALRALRILTEAVQ